MQQTNTTNIGAWSRPLVVALACAIVYLGLAALIFRADGHWSPDSALRYVQVEGLLRQRFSTLAVPYPGAEIDPEGRYFPAGAWFHAQRDGAHYITYLPYFAALTAPLFHLFGAFGLVVLPALAGAVVVGVTYRFLARRAPDVAGLGSLAVAIATPLVAYATSYWDHAIVTALAAGGLAAIATAMQAPTEDRWPRSVLLAGVALGFGPWLRNEMYVLLAATAAAWMVLSGEKRWRGAFALAAGAALPLLTLWIANLKLFGHPLSFKGADLVQSRATAMGGAAGGAATGGGVEWLGKKLAVAYYQLISPDFYRFDRASIEVGLAFALSLLVAGALVAYGVRRTNASFIRVGGMALAGIGGVLLLGRTNLSGLLPVMPFAVLAFLPGHRQRWEVFLWTVGVLFVSGVIVTATTGGLQWGPRYLMPIVPPVAWLAIAAVDRARVAAPSVWPALRVAAFFAIGVSALLQASGLDQIDQVIGRSRTANAALRAAPGEVLVTSFEWLAIGAGPLYYEKPLLLVHDIGELEALSRALSDRRVRAWTYVPLSGPSYDPSYVVRWTAGSAWPYRVAADRTEPGGMRLVTFAHPTRPPGGP